MVSRPAGFESAALKPPFVRLEMVHEPRADERAMTSLGRCREAPVSVAK
jgi:hypothetical protein